MENSENRENEYEISLVDIFSSLIKRWWIVAVSTVAAGLIAFIYFAFLVTPTYVSNARILVGREEDPRDTTTSFTINTLNIATDLTQEFKYLIKEPIVLEPVVESLGLNVSANSLSKSISVSTPGSNLRILDISVSATTPETAYKINEELVKQCEQILPTIHDHAKIRIIVTTPASLPTSPSSPNVAMYTVLGLLIGAILSAAVILVYDMFIKKNFSASKNTPAVLSETASEAADVVSFSAPATDKKSEEGSPAKSKKTKN